MYTIIIRPKEQVSKTLDSSHMALCIVHYFGVSSFNELELCGQKHEEGLCYFDNHLNEWQELGVIQVENVDVDGRSCIHLLNDLLLATK